MPARAILSVDALLRESLDVVDISVGGMALVMKPTEAGARMKLTVTLGSDVEHVLDVEVRWAAMGMVGVEFIDPSPATAQAVQKYVAELLERGAAV